jgi:hypothetical protein
MKKRSVKNKRLESKATSKKPAGGQRGTKAKNKKQMSPGRRRTPRRPEDKDAKNRGPKTEIEGLQSPALVQLLIRAATDYSLKPQRKSERLVVRATKEILMRLGHSRKEAKTLTGKIMEQMQ